MDVRRFFPWTIATVALILSPAFANTPQSEPDQKWIENQFFHSEQYRHFLEDILDHFEPAPLAQECPTLKVQGDFSGGIMIEQPTFVQVGEGYKVSAGKWMARVTVDRCGATATRSVLLEAVPGSDDLRPTALPPGNFQGNLKLAMDAQSLVVSKLGTAAGCKAPDAIYILDTKPASVVKPEGWSELWKAQACGQTLYAKLKYTAAYQGSSMIGMKIQAAISATP